jgi:hypothetical protein
MMRGRVCWTANTMATSDALASAVAEARSVPGSNFTTASLAFFVIPSNGAERWYSVMLKIPRGSPGARSGDGGTALPPAGDTWPEPPPDNTPASACPPITAIDFTPAGFSGN